MAHGIASKLLPPVFIYILIQYLFFTLPLMLTPWKNTKRSSEIFRSLSAQKSRAVDHSNVSTGLIHRSCTRVESIKIDRYFYWWNKNERKIRGWAIVVENNWKILGVKIQQAVFLTSPSPHPLSEANHGQTVMLRYCIPLLLCCMCRCTKHGIIIVVL